jgi:hypothetical protein
LSESEIDALIGKGLGHTRRVVDSHLFVFIGSLWLLLVIFTIGSVVVAFASAG